MPTLRLKECVDKNPDYYGEMAQTNDDNQEEKIIEVDPNEGKEVTEVPVEVPATEVPATEAPVEVPATEVPVEVPEPTAIPNQVHEESSKDL